MNQFSKRFIPYEEYFGEMELDEAQIESRVLLAYKLQEVFMNTFEEIKLQEFDKLNNIETIDIESLENGLSEDFANCIDEFGYNLETYPYLADYSVLVAGLIIGTTVDNGFKDEYLSDERAMCLAEEESNSVENYGDFQEAINQGKSEKEWITIRDKKVRHTHSKVDGTRIGIMDVFDVGDSMFLYPRGQEYQPSAKEVVNCRCSLKYY